MIYHGNGVWTGSLNVAQLEAEMAKEREQAQTQTEKKEPPKPASKKARVTDGDD